MPDPNLGSPFTSQTLIAAVVATLTLAAPTPSAGDEPAADDATSAPEAPASDYNDYPGFSGAFSSVTLRGGLPLTRWNANNDGWSLDAGVRHAFPAYVGDIRAAYHLERVNAEAGQLTRHGLSFHAAFHPGFYFLAGSDWLPYVIASIYADIGVEAALYTGDASGVGAVPSFSAGVDLPLGDPDSRPIPWLHLSWRRYLGSTFSADLAPAPYSTIQIGLAWRTNRTTL
jgi:hypothetical protein